MSLLTDRMIRAAKLDPALYEEVEADATAMRQAMTVVIISSLAAGIGALGTLGLRGLVLGIVWALGGWFIWAYITYFIGTKLLPEPQTSSSHGELLRTLGFSSSPGILRVAGIVPVLGTLVNMVTAIWMLSAMVIAVKQALDYKSYWRAVGVCLIGWVVQMVLLFVIIGVFYPH
jgi:hypothetical protein